MGVDFGDSIPREKIQLEDIAGWRLAVDGYNTLYQFLAIIRGMDGGTSRTRREGSLRTSPGSTTATSTSSSSG